MSLALACHKCKADIAVDPATPFSFREVCPRCDADAHCCLNCRHYDASAHRECRETIDQRIPDKEKNNYCDAFQPRSGSAAAGATPALDPLAAAEALFKKGS